VRLGHRHAALITAGQQRHDPVGVLGKPTPARLDQGTGAAGPQVGTRALADVVSASEKSSDPRVLEPASPFHENPSADPGARPAWHAAGGGKLTTALSLASPAEAARASSALSIWRPSPKPWKSSRTVIASSPASSAFGMYLASAASRPGSDAIAATRHTAPGATSMRANRATTGGAGREE